MSETNSTQTKTQQIDVKELETVIGGKKSGRQLAQRGPVYCDQNMRPKGCVFDPIGPGGRFLL